jgi:hypothetical protein
MVSRYTKKTYRPNTKDYHPASVLITPGVEVVNTRLLIEHATSMLSGAMETNHSIWNIFYGEHACGLRASVVHCNPRDVSIKFTRAKTPVVSLSNWGKRKCMRGQSAILVY